MVRAAVLTGVGRPLEICELELEPPRAHEVMVRLAASGVCHSDLSMQNGTTMVPTPVVLGHEGAGIVEEVGEGVTAVEAGDHVVISWVPQCGDCFFCAKAQPHLCEASNVVLASAGLLDGTPRFSSGGRPVHQMVAAGTFAERTVVPEWSVVPVDDDLDLQVAALMGCAVLTGVGAALNTAHIGDDDSVAVVGCGGVGLNVVQGARLAGAARVIAVDLNPAKLDLALEFGATDTIDASQANAVSKVMALTDQRGADVSFEVVGLEASIDQAIAMTRRGGQAVLVGLPRMDAMITVPAFLGAVMAAKTITGCWYGSADVRRDVPRLVGHYRSGELKLDELISATISLEDVNDAFEAMENGDVARSVIRYAGA
ncbi:MAG: Zn-dependent alcohol dehydrogenase [Actinomycetota bacterium]|nr:Zn-dependent alcohol dehydrogenase [Actinomycetota bacterium]